MSSRSGQTGVSLGDLLAATGAVILLVSLWRPWYELRFPDEVLAQAREFSSRMGELGPFAQQGIDELQARGAVPVTAWQIFEQADTLLAVAAGLVLGLVLLNAFGALAARQDGVIVLIGLVAAGLVAFRLVSPPGADMPAGLDLLHPATGAYLALAGALLMAGGGMLAAMRTGAPAPAAPAQTVRPDQIKIWDAS